MVRISDLQRERVCVIRQRGASYGRIAAELGLSRNTVKSICQRAGIQVQTDVQNSSVCEQCQTPLEAPGLGRRFCCSECRLAWWHAHPQCLNRKAIYTFTCAGCGVRFEAYGNSGRKYCCHGCYIRARFGTKGGRP